METKGVTELRVIQYFYKDKDGKRVMTNYALQYRHGLYAWQSVPIVMEQINPPIEDNADDT